MNAVTGFVIVCLALSAQSSPNPLIINGIDAPNDLYSYQVSLRDNNDEYFCGGAIINNRFIITAAGCIINYIENPYNIYVGMGSNYLNESSVTIRAKNIIVHAGYNARLFLHDIGLIQLSEDIKFNENITSIALATIDRDYNDYPLVITGWGLRKVYWFEPVLSYLYPNHLQEILVKGLSQEKCKNWYENIKKPHICTYTMYGEGMCTGDTGNPVVADGTLIGVVSNTKCGFGFPDVSTRIFHYRTWIEYYTEI